MINLTIEAPKWTDVVQAIATSLAVPGAIAAFWALFRRDKNKEAQIANLSDIASQLAQMQAENERRYKASKKPKIEISLTHAHRVIKVDFVNPNATIHSYQVENGYGNANLLKHTIISQGNSHVFSVGISYKDVAPEVIVLHMDYETEEGYLFIQEVMIWKVGNVYKLSPSVVIDKVHAAQ